MTYKQLAALINNMPEAHQALDVAIYCHNCDEWYPAAGIKYTNDSQDVLDTDHPYITLESVSNVDFFQ